MENCRRKAVRRKRKTVKVQERESLKLKAKMRR